MTRKSIYHILLKYKLLIISVTLLFLTVVVLQVNYNKNHMKNFTVDEYYTISAIHPSLNPGNTVHRVLNGPSVFTYLFYPGALVGMIGHMGGNIYAEGWDYPGHNYIVRNYTVYSARQVENMEDPNLRYFHYYLKLQAIFFMFLTFIPLVYYLWKKELYIGMFMLAALVGINLLGLEQRSLFYIEPLLLSMINLLLWLYLYIYDKNRISWFLVLTAAFLFALSISLKFSCVFMVAMIAILLLLKFRGLENRIKATLALLLLTSMFFYIINWNIFSSKEVFNAAVHDYFSNFYQYATGNKGSIVENYKFYNFKGVVKELFSSFGGIIFLFPVIAFYGLKWFSRPQRIKWGVLLFVVLLSIAFIIKQRVYLDRNILPFLPSLMLLTGILLDGIFRHLSHYKFLKKRKNTILLHVILAVLILCPIWLHHKDYFKTLLPNAKTNILHELQTINNPKERRLVTMDFIVGEEKTDFKKEEKLNSFPETNALNLNEELRKKIEYFKPTDVVLLSETKNNKQLTNYLLPALYNSNAQFSDYFVFHNDPTKDTKYIATIRDFEDKNSKSLLLDSIKIREDLILQEIRLIKKNTSYKLYFKFTFLEMKTKKLLGCRFYFHAYPYEKDKQIIPEDRRQYGYENWDFSVTQENYAQYGNTIYIAHDFIPSVTEYRRFSFGIFKGCPKSKDVNVENIEL